MMRFRNLGDSDDFEVVNNGLKFLFIRKLDVGLVDVKRLFGLVSVKLDGNVILGERGREAGDKGKKMKTCEAAFHLNLKALKEKTVREPNLVEAFRQTAYVHDRHIWLYHREE
ncbi:hypothetical protein HAX54_046020 [Datura stramonium]|uniref:Uncharacterized protein n=1 Tax=Datura stramonium TaxID=4076 RepID=A0ABS8WGC9_DATST|nr:hypothetical protein [Datura stramonium]